MNKLKLDDLKRVQTGEAGVAIPKLEKRVAFLQRDVALFGRTFDDKIKQQFYTQLLVLSSAGVELSACLETVEAEFDKDRVQRDVQRIRANIARGDSLSNALEETGLFSPYEVYSVRIGEESGKLQIVFEELSLYFNKRINQRRQIVQTAAYPLFVLTVSAGAVFFMLYVIVPVFTDVFKRFGSDLPPLTKWVLSSSAVLKKWFPLIAGLNVAALLFLFSQKEKIWFRRFSSRLILKLPFFGNVVNKIYLAKFCNSMKLLVGSDTPLDEALRLVKGMIGYYPIESNLDGVRHQIVTGKSLHESFAAFPVYPRSLLALIKIGEDVNRLEKSFAVLSDQYSREVDYKISILGTVLEPMIIVVLGLVIGLILVAMYLPIFQLSTAIN